MWGRDSVHRCSKAIGSDAVQRKTSVCPEEVDRSALLSVPFDVGTHLVSLNEENRVNHCGENQDTANFKQLTHS